MPFKAESAVDSALSGLEPKNEINLIRGFKATKHLKQSRARASLIGMPCTLFDTSPLKADPVFPGVPHLSHLYPLPSRNANQAGNLTPLIFTARYCLHKRDIPA
ncbi:hypothetical protein D3C86_898510 [compost metagenome]